MFLIYSITQQCIFSVGKQVKARNNATEYYKIFTQHVTGYK